MAADEEESIPLTHVYSRLPGAEDAGLEDTGSEPTPPTRSSRLLACPLKISKLPWMVHGLLIMAYTIGFVGLYASFPGSLHPHKWDSDERSHIYSPLWDQVEYKNLRFSSGPWVKTPYKGAPTPAIDEAWNAIVPLYLIRIPAAAIPHLNKSATAATFPGSSDYLGTVDAFHQLHCVNLVRKYTYADYYKDIDIAWRDPPDMLRTHVDHCIDVLRQKIMCDADVSVITYSWVEGREHVLPDFSNTHRCRNFDKVRDWVLENKMDMGSREITKSKEAVSVPTEAL